MNDPSDRKGDKNYVAFLRQAVDTLDRQETGGGAQSPVNDPNGREGNGTAMLDGIYAIMFDLLIW